MVIKRTSELVGTNLRAKNHAYETVHFLLESDGKETGLQKLKCYCPTSSLTPSVVRGLKPGKSEAKNSPALASPCKY